jgi:hypothetical protein
MIDSSREERRSLIPALFAMADQGANALSRSHDHRASAFVT